VRSSLRQGDMYALPLADGSADCVIIHQVLHYAHAAGRRDCRGGAGARSGRTLLVVDFAAHDREELRARDAHLRLGFADEVMAAGFRRGRPGDRPCRAPRRRRADGHLVARGKPGPPLKAEEAA
jgi:hypothetical protein